MQKMLYFYFNYYHSHLYLNNCHPVANHTLKVFCFFLLNAFKRLGKRKKKTQFSLCDGIISYSKALKWAIIFLIEENYCKDTHTQKKQSTLRTVILDVILEQFHSVFSLFPRLPKSSY